MGAAGTPIDKTFALGCVASAPNEKTFAFGAAAEGAAEDTVDAADWAGAVADGCVVSPVGLFAILIGACLCCCCG